MEDETTRPLAEIDGLLIDIDGVLTVSWRPIPGARQALVELDRLGVPYRLLTNTTELTREALAGTLETAGFDVRPEDLITAPVITAAYLRANHPGARCFLVASTDLSEDLEGVLLVEEQADVVVIAGATEEPDWGRMLRAFRMLLDGAALVVMHRSLTWMTEQGMMLDAHVAIVPGLEEATGVPAEVVGKPAPESFRQSLAILSVPAERSAMVGDDVDSDVLAAQACGLTGILVRTGKFGPTTLSRATGRPDHVIDSIAHLPRLLRP